MQVSVIIAVYNRAALLSDLLDHWRKVDEVTKYEYELIFSDDESSDNSVSLLRQCTDLPIRVLTNPHGGAAKARNHAYHYATGEIIIFTGDDIFPSTNFVNEHYESYLKNGDNYATLGCIDWRKGIQMNHLMKHITDIGCEQFGFVGMRPFEIVDFRHFYTSNISVSLKKLQQLEELFDTTFKKYGFEDVELGYRLNKLGVQIIYNPTALGYHDHIYDSVTKFCKRQESAGEELNTFKRLHPELGLNEIKFDIDEFYDRYTEYASERKSIDITGDMGRLSIYLMMQCTKVFEKILQKKDSYKIKKLCSKFYSAIFSYYMYLGLAEGYTECQPVKKVIAQRFTFRYLFFGRSQIFYDQNNNFTEKNSIFFRTAGRKTLTIKATIPDKALGRIRIDPLDHYCKIKLNYAYAHLMDGSRKDLEFEFTNAKRVKRNYYDFSNQVDPVMITDYLPLNTLSVEINYKMNYLLRKRIYHASSRAVSLCKKIMKRLFNSPIKKKQRHTTPQVIPLPIVNPEETKKKVWITLTGLPDEALAILVEGYKKDCAFLKNLHIDTTPCSSHEYREYVYEITAVDHAIETSQLINAALCLLEYYYDFIIVSDYLKSFPIVSGYSLKDSTILSRHLAPFSKFASSTQSSTGKFMRVPGSQRISNELNANVQIPTMNVMDEKILYIHQPREILRINNIDLRTFKKSRPVVFVLPVFMAVGGVERNTIEIMERLKNDYDFVVISFEYHRTEQGSLFYQIAELGIDYYDFAEISSFDYYFDLLEKLKYAYSPDLLWICNSSPWVMDNNAKLRRVFHNTAIVVQDVYDYEYGWIQYYNKPAIHSYDRFIAINQKIKDKFINTYGINSDNIDLVYSAVDTKKIYKASSDNFSRDDELRLLNLDPQKRYFAFIGRFTEQKQPLKLLHLAKHIIETYKDVDFVMVGDGELSPEVERIINSDANMKKRVHRINYISEVSKFIKAIDGLLIASIYEGLPIVTIEAMCVGTPICSTDVGDIALFVKENNIGVISESHEFDALKKAFDEFYLNLDIFKMNALKHTSENINFFSSQRAAELMNLSFQKAIEKYNH